MTFLQCEIEVPRFDLLNNSSNSTGKEVCKNCEDSKVVGHGSYKGRDRYMCKSCKKSINDYTRTAIFGIKKVEKSQSYPKLMLESVTIRKASKILELNTKKVLDWRHKIASSLEEINDSKFSGTVECDDKLININKKGSKKFNQ